MRFCKLWLSFLWWHRASADFLLRVPLILLQAAVIAREVDRRAIEHIHAHFATYPALAALAAASLADVTFSVTVHAHDLFVDEVGLYERLRSARFIACISEFNRRFLSQRYPAFGENKLPLIRCGVDLSRFRPVTAQSSRNLLRILCVAALKDYKGQDVLVEACTQLSERLGAFECLLVGVGPLRMSLEARIRDLNLDNRVRLLGAKTEEEVAELLASADVFVAPSVVASDGMMDGIPVALMEALATGLPVVASDVSGISELVIHEETGLLVPPGDPVALAAAIERLHRDQVLASRISNHGREHVQRFFSLDPNIDRLERLFEQILSEPPGSSGVRRQGIPTQERHTA